MRTLGRAALIAGGAVLALGLGTAAAVAATGDGGGDDGVRVVQPGGSTSPMVEDRIPRPTPSDPPSAVPVPSPADDHGVDDPATHDVGDDHGSGGHGSDD